jgi:hypothetical protein
MTTTGSDDSLSGEARRFLLGQLSAEEAEQFEERVLGSEDVFVEVESAEDDLFDAFVRDALAPAERRAFLERFGDRQERIDFARALDARVRDRNVLPHRRRNASVRRFLLAAAASIVIITGAILAWRSRTVGPVDVATTAATASTGIRPAIAPTAPAVAVATLEIALVGTRGDGQPPHLVLSPGTSEIALGIRINAADRFPSYRVVIRNSEGSTVWSGPAPLASPGRLAIQIPASLFASGYYELAVSGTSERGSESDLGYMTITISHRAP